MNRGSLARSLARHGPVAVLVAVLGCARQPPPRPPAPAGDARANPPAAREEAAARGPAESRLPVRPRGEAAAPIVADPTGFDPITTSPGVRDGEIQARIDWWLEYWRTRGAAALQRGLARMGGYEDFVTAELKERNLPPSLVHLPLIEANYYPPAVSPAGAAGLWQFMPHTASWLGLRVDPIVDERFDPFAATPAALDYIVDLKEQFGSWFLALAAYNAGPGRVEGAIRRHGDGMPRDDALFVRIRPRLPSETRDFVPKYLAAVRAATAPAYHGLPLPVKDPPLRFDVVEVEGAATIDVIALAAGVAEEEVEGLNPHLRAGVTPVVETTPVRLPEGRGPDFAERFALIPPRERVSRHVVAAGETLTHIALRYGTSVDALRAANPGVRPRFLQIGETLAIPVRHRALTAGDRASAAPAPTSADASTDPATSSADRARPRTDASSSDDPPAETVHIVRRGESLWLIARMYGVRPARLRSHNGLPRDPLIQPGDTIRIPPSG